MFNPNVKKLYHAVIIFGICLLLIILAILKPAIYNNSDFSAYNTGWNGCSDIAYATYQAEKLLPQLSIDKSNFNISTKSYIQYSSDPIDTTILIIGPRKSFTNEEIEYMKFFLNEGGFLFLADDFGTGNELLSKINATSQFSNQLMMDLSFEKNASFVVIFDIINISHPLTENITGLLLNYPTSLYTNPNSIILAKSSKMSWLDTNANSKKDDDELNGPFTILAIEPYGKGEIVLFSDPSLLINSMENQIDNKIFNNQLLNYLLNNRNTIIIDESHRIDSIPFYFMYIFPSSIGFEFKISIILILLLIYLLLFTRLPTFFTKKILKIFYKSKKLPQEKINLSLIDDVIKKHPSWNRYKLEKIVKRFEKNG